jgi:hypothetical protein
MVTDIALPVMQTDERRALAGRAAPSPGVLPSAVTGRLYGFNLDDQPLVTGVPTLPNEVVPARSTVPLRQEHLGSVVLLVFQDGDPHRPIVIGMIADTPTVPVQPPRHAPVTAHADGERVVIQAEREIVLRCGDAAITLTRAGKVLISGKYVVSRSSGSNKIKGAAVEIN